MDSAEKGHRLSGVEEAVYLFCREVARLPRVVLGSGCDGQLVVACTRGAETPPLRGVPEALSEAGAEASIRAPEAVARPDAGLAMAAESASPFALIARGPYTWQPCPMENAGREGRGRSPPA